MTQYLISFNDGAMSHIPEEDFPAVTQAAVAVVPDAMDASDFLFGSGLLDSALTTVVGTDGSVTPGPNPACRCAQDVREFMPVPAEMAGRA